MDKHYKRVEEEGRGLARINERRKRTVKRIFKDKTSPNNTTGTVRSSRGPHSAFAIQMRKSSLRSFSYFYLN